MLYFQIWPTDSLTTEALPLGSYKTNADIGTLNAWCGAKGIEFTIHADVKDEYATGYCYISPAQMTKDIAAAQPPEASKSHEYTVGAKKVAPTSGTVYVQPTHSKHDDIPSYQIGPSLEDLQNPYVSPTLASWRDKHPYIANTERAYELFYATVDILKETYTESKKPVRRRMRTQLAEAMGIEEKEAKKVLKGE